MLQSGFAKVDITPPLGTTVAGYYEVRHADGVLDPLYAIAVAFDDGERRAVLMTIDFCEAPQWFSDEMRARVASAVGIPTEAVFIAATHTHLGPEVATAEGERKNPEYTEWMLAKLADTAVLAFRDLAPTEMLCTRGHVEGVSFVRRFRMKDGSVQTNPGLQNPDIVCPLGTPDEESQLLILKREGKGEIGIVNFQVHPDVIAGCAFSADYPKFVRDTYEKMIDGSHCLYLNGTQGDTNHIDVSLGENDLVAGYDRARYMGKKIAASVLANYELAKPLAGDQVRFGQKNVEALYNKGKPEQLEDAIRRSQIYHAEGLDAATPEYTGMRKIEVVSEAERIVRLMDYPDTKEIYVSALAVGDAVFVGFAGEPFTDVGRQVKAGAPFALTMTACCANGCEAYFPTAQAFSEGGYEVVSTSFTAGTAEKLIAGALELANNLSGR